jgi:dienelactone hydrolase
MNTIKIIFIFIIGLSCLSCTTTKVAEQKSNTASLAPMPSSKNPTIQLLDFPSLDGLILKADYYFLEAGAPIIVMCHQAGWSRGEYLEIAPKLNKLGYNCLALDQRSGESVNGIKNETAQRAKDQNLPTNYLDAEQDIKAAVRWAKLNSPKKGIILWGSSYSASLVLKVAKEEAAVAKVISFSPGEYFGKDLNLAETVKGLEKPTFITCANDEIKETKKIFKAVGASNKTFFKPKTKGNHGSRALWGKFEDQLDYWKAVKIFLSS